MNCVASKGIQPISKYNYVICVGRKEVTGSTVQTE